MLRPFPLGHLWLDAGRFEAFVPEGAVCGEVSPSGKVLDVACVVLRGTPAEANAARVRVLAAVSRAVRGG